VVGRAESADAPISRQLPDHVAIEKQLTEWYRNVTELFIASSRGGILFAMNSTPEATSIFYCETASLGDELNRRSRARSPTAGDARHDRDRLVRAIMDSRYVALSLSKGGTKTARFTFRNRDGQALPDTIAHVQYPTQEAARLGMQMALEFITTRFPRKGDRSRLI